MRNRWLKKVVSLLLSALMLAAVPVIAFSDDAVETFNSDGTPIVLVTGYTNNAIYSNPQSSRRVKEFPPNINTDVKFGQYLGIYLGGIDDVHYSQTTEAIFPEVMSWFEAIRCNYDGTSRAGGTGVVSFNTYDADGKIVAQPMSLYSNNPDFQYMVAGELGLIYGEAVGEENVYVYSSDWRLDPIVRGAELSDFVDSVKEQTGAKKVNMVSDGMGAIVSSVYLDKYADFSDLKNYVTLDSAANGATIFGDLYSGEIDVDPNGMVRYINDLPDNVITAGAFYLVTRILNDQHEIYDFALHTDLYLIAEKNRIYNIYVRDLLNVMPGLWAMVPYTYYDEAMAFMYPAGYREINHNLKSALDEYHAIQYRAGENLVLLKNAGVNVSIVSGYGMQSLPLTTYGTVETGNRVVDTRFSSYGAETAFLNDVYVGKGLRKQINDDGHDHTDASKNLFPFGARIMGFQVDASTCHLPENTWFINGFKRGYWHHASDSVYYFLTWLALSDTQRSIHDDPYYPQFLKYNRFNDVPGGDVYARSMSDTRRYYIPGDCDLDGEITAADARIALQQSAFIIDLKRAAFANADLDGDGTVVAAEARKILRMSAKLEKYDRNEKFD